MACEFPVAVWRSFCELLYTYFSFYLIATTIREPSAWGLRARNSRAPRSDATGGLEETWTTLDTSWSSSIDWHRSRCWLLTNMSSSRNHSNISPSHGFSDWVVQLEYLRLVSNRVDPFSFPFDFGVIFEIGLIRDMCITTMLLFSTTSPTITITNLLMFLLSG